MTLASLFNESYNVVRLLEAAWKIQLWIVDTGTNTPLIIEAA